MRLQLATWKSPTCTCWHSSISTCHWQSQRSGWRNCVLCCNLPMTSIPRGIAGSLKCQRLQKRQASEAWQMRRTTFNAHSGLFIKAATQDGCCHLMFILLQTVSQLEGMDLWNTIVWPFGNHSNYFIPVKHKVFEAKRNALNSTKLLSGLFVFWTTLNLDVPADHWAKSRSCFHWAGIWSYQRLWMRIVTYDLQKEIAHRQRPHLPKRAGLGGQRCCDLWWPCKVAAWRRCLW